MDFIRNLTGLEKVDWTAKAKVSPAPKEGKPFQLEVRGTYGVRVIDPIAFANSMNEMGASTPRQIHRTLEGVITRRLKSMIHESVHSVNEVESRFVDVAVETRLGVKYQFSRMGLDLVDFLVLSIEPRGGIPTSKPKGKAKKRTGGRPPSRTLSRPRVGRAQELKFPRRRD